MSYARFGWNGSSVYVYLDVSGYLRCCGCPLHPEDFGSYNFETTAALFSHLTAHVAAGDEVPSATWSELWADREENDSWIAAGAPEGWNH